MSLEPKSAVEEVNIGPPRKPRFTLTVLHLPRNVYLLLFFTLVCQTLGQVAHYYHGHVSERALDDTDWVRAYTLVSCRG